MNSTQKNAVSFLSWVAVCTIILICSQPILNAVSLWVEVSVKGLPVLGQLISLVSAIPWFGKGLALVLLTILKHAGVIAALAVYGLINLTQIGLVGGPRERAIAYFIEAAISLLSITIYGDGFYDLAADFPNFDADLLDWHGVWKLFFSLFGPELAFGFLTSVRDSRYYTSSNRSHRGY
jgi:hypothetical protein